jgi:hypothetical protein
MMDALAGLSAKDRMNAALGHSASNWYNGDAGGPVYPNKMLAVRAPDPNKPAGAAGFQQKPPPTYVCHRCNQSGHYIQFCPTNTDPDWKPTRLVAPKGVPTDRLRAVAKPAEGQEASGTYYELDGKWCVGLRAFISGGGSACALKTH